jgi:type I restriction enzyme R subunit
MDGNEDIFGKLMSDGEFRRLAMEHLLHKVYGALKGRGAGDQKGQI